MQEQPLPGMPKAKARAAEPSNVHLDAIWGVRITGDDAPGYGVRLNFVNAAGRIVWSHQFPLAPHMDPRHVGMCIGDLVRNYGRLARELELAQLPLGPADIRALMVPFQDLLNAP